MVPALDSQLRCGAPAVPARRSAARRRSAVAAVVVVVVLAGAGLSGVVGPATGSAQDQSVEDARRQRDETLAEKARAAEQLDVLRAHEGQVRAALADLDE